MDEQGLSVRSRFPEEVARAIKNARAQVEAVKDSLKETIDEGHRVVLSMDAPTDASRGGGWRRGRRAYCDPWACRPTISVDALLRGTVPGLDIRWATFE